MLFERVDDRPCRTVARIDDDLERLQRLDVDVCQDVLDVLVEHIDFFNLPLRAIERLEVALHHGLLNVLEPRIARNRARFLAHELHAVVLLRIVTRRDHDAAVQPIVRRREIDHLRAALPDVHDVGARLRQPLRKSATNRRSGKTNIVPDCDLLRMEEIDENAPDAIGKLLIDLLWINSTDVIRAETLVADFHNCHLFLLNTLPYDFMDY